MAETHSIKTREPYWSAQRRGEKLFEVRRDDRGYQKGDILLCRRYGPPRWSTMKAPDYLDEHGDRTSEDDAATNHFEIVYVLTGGQFGIELGYVVLQLKPLTAMEKANG
jgi:Domain of unknown function (DUF3850)